MDILAWHNWFLVEAFFFLFPVPQSVVGFF
jgi:hypothetical protein